MFIGQASAWTSSEFTKDDAKITQYAPTLTKYGSYEVYEKAWYDPLGLWTETKTAEVVLDFNEDNCVNCKAEGRTTLLEDGKLVDEIGYYEKGLLGTYTKNRDVTNSKLWLRSDEFYNLKEVSYDVADCDDEGLVCSYSQETKLVPMKEVDNYERVCVPEEYYIDELVEVERLSVNGTLEWVNETQPVLQTRYLCEQVLNGTKWVEQPE